MAALPLIPLPGPSPRKRGEGGYPAAGRARDRGPPVVRRPRGGPAASAAIRPV